MAFWMQTKLTNSLICFKLFKFCPKFLNEKKLKMFVLFFGYPAYPMKMVQNKGFGC